MSGMSGGFTLKDRWIPAFAGMTKRLLCRVYPEIPKQVRDDSRGTRNDDITI